jgi:beta-N-acetylhexosaminidase
LIGRQIARNALLAGNDLLYVNNFISSGDADAFETLNKTLDFFSQKYREDQAFAQRVNASVERNLSLKFKLYPEISENTILQSEAAWSLLRIRSNCVRSRAAGCNPYQPG